MFFRTDRRTLVEILLPFVGNRRILWSVLSKSFSPVSCRADGDSFVVSYLVSSCGMSPETAVSLSKKVHFTSAEKPDSVLNLLREYGFTNVVFSKVIRSHPRFLLSNPEKTFLPKLKFFRSLGIANSDLARMIAGNPNLLAISLENQILPVHNFLKSIGILATHPSFGFLMTRSLENQLMPYYNALKSVLHCDKKVAAAMKIKIFTFFFKDSFRNMEPNITCLMEAGVPEPKIAYLLSYHTLAVVHEPSLFKKTVNEVKKMGFDPLKSNFVLAVRVLSGPTGQSIWKRSCKTYSEWGWSDDEILTAFRKHPLCMILSEKNLNKTMDFLVNKMGWNSQMIARDPSVLSLSLEKRIIPRCSVFQVLLSKGLVRKDLCLRSVLSPVEKYFLDRFVFRYEEEVPLLLSVYHGKMGADDFNL